MDTTYLWHVGVPSGILSVSVLGALALPALTLPVPRAQLPCTQRRQCMSKTLNGKAAIVLVNCAADPGYTGSWFFPSHIPDPGSNNNKKRRGGNFVVLFFVFLWSHFHKIYEELNFFYPKKFLPEIFFEDPRIGKNLYRYRIPYPDGRGQDYFCTVPSSKETCSTITLRRWKHTSLRSLPHFCKLLSADSAR
jgi:hypothetical protein